MPPPLRRLTADEWIAGFKFRKWVDPSLTQAEWNNLVLSHSDEEWEQLQQLPEQERDIIYCQLLKTIRELKENSNDS